MSHGSQRPVDDAAVHPGHLGPRPRRGRPWLIILPARWAWERYQDRKASREAQALLRRWEATHPLEPEDEHARLAQIKDQLWLESLTPHVQAYILRQRLEEAEREERARALWHAERQAQQDGHDRTGGP